MGEGAQLPWPWLSLWCLLAASLPAPRASDPVGSAGSARVVKQEEQKTSSAGRALAGMFRRARQAGGRPHYIVSRRTPQVARALGLPVASLPSGDLPQLADFSTCAVVGSSDSLLGSDQGPAIDAHTAVIRFNAAPTRGYEPHVGGRTTLRLQNSFFSGFSEGGAGELCLVRMGALAGKEQQGPSGAPDGCHEVCVMSPHLEAYRRALWADRADRPKWSSGFIGIALAANLCGQVDVYGFTHGGSGTGYYYDKVHRKKGDKEGRTGRRRGQRQRDKGGGGVAAGHPWELERRCKEELAAQGQLALHS